LALLLFYRKAVIKDLKKKSITGAEGLIGEIGIVLEWNDEKRLEKAESMEKFGQSNQMIH